MCLIICIYRFRSGQEARHAVCRLVHGGGAQVGIDVRRRRERGVAEPQLDLLHGNALRHQKAGTCMPIRYNYDKPENPVFMVV